MRQDIGPQVPQLPPGAIEFAKELGKLASKYNFRSLMTKVECERSQSGDSATVEVAVSNVDGRGRPRTKIVVMGEFKIRHVVEWQPDTTD